MLFSFFFFFFQLRRQAKKETKKVFKDEKERLVSARIRNQGAGLQGRHVFKLG